MLAHGRDPNYEGWVYTVQLDLAQVCAGVLVGHNVAEVRVARGGDRDIDRSGFADDLEHVNDDPDEYGLIRTIEMPEPNMVERLSAMRER